MTTKYLTPEDVCKRYGVSINTVYGWTSTNYIPHLKIGGKLYFPEAVLNRWDEGHLVGAIDFKLV